MGWQEALGYGYKSGYDLMIRAAGNSSHTVRDSADNIAYRTGAQMLGEAPCVLRGV